MYGDVLVKACNEIAVVVMNQTDKVEAFMVWLNGKSIISNLVKRSISTFVIE